MEKQSIEPFSVVTGFNWRKSTMNICGITLWWCADRRGGDCIIRSLSAYECQHHTDTKTYPHQCIHVHWLVSRYCNLPTASPLWSAIIKLSSLVLGLSQIRPLDGSEITRKSLWKAETVINPLIDSCSKSALLSSAELSEVSAQKFSPFSKRICWQPVFLAFPSHLQQRFARVSVYGRLTKPNQSLKIVKFDQLTSVALRVFFFSTIEKCFLIPPFFLFTNTLCYLESVSSGMHTRTPFNLANWFRHCDK